MILRIEMTCGVRSVSGHNARYSLECWWAEDEAFVDDPAYEGAGNADWGTYSQTQVVTGPDGVAEVEFTPGPNLGTFYWSWISDTVWAR